MPARDVAQELGQLAEGGGNLDQLCGVTRLGGDPGDLDPAGAELLSDN